MTTSRPTLKILRDKFKHFARSLAKITTGIEPETSILEPILVNSTGRSGTTLLMQLLGTSPQIAFDRNYPFEVRYLSYLLHWALLLNTQWQPNESWNPAENLKHPGRQIVGPFPYANAKLWPGPGMELWPKCFETAWQEFSRTVISKVKGINGTGIYPQYYAEKISLWVTEYLEQQAIPYRSLFLIRDPRDVFLSISAFDKQRGFAGFNRYPEDTDLDFAKRLMKSYQHMHKHKIMTSPSNLVVKYENLATDLPGEAQRLSQWLNVELNAALVKNQEAQFKHHMTSVSPEKSVERWRHELSKELNDFFIQELGEELRYFGYET